MGKLPVVSGKDAVRAFTLAGYDVSHQTGSHIIMRRTTPPHRHLSIPNHKELARGTLRGLIRDTGLSVEEFLVLLNRI
jgi:predicted RNA binding protein YcfA (HicA-like mRNA interferase family)